jgi:RNA polymerase primary sigma factor
MIKANLRLVVKIARDYQLLGMPLLDLISEGNIGLMKAVDRFDPGKGAKFSTYGAQWIKQAIRRVLSNQSREIRLPIPILQQISHLGEASARLRGSLGREPSDEELAEDLATDVKHVRHWRASAAIRPTSLDTPLNGDDENNRVADVVADEHAATPYDQLEQKTDQALVRRIVATLNPREQSILRQRFGLDGGEEKTLAEVGEEFGVTRERIRQIQLEALQKLRQELMKVAGMEFAE